MDDFDTTIYDDVVDESMNGVDAAARAIDTMGDYDIADEAINGAQSIAEAVMTTTQSFAELGIRFLLNLLVCWIIIQFFYYRKSKRRDYYFTFIIFSSAMLLLLYMMGKVDVGVGLTLGLFAIFGVIRYRTETVPIREMTYLFVIIAIAAVNGLAPVYEVVDSMGNAPHYDLSEGSLLVTVVANVLMIVLIGIFETDRLIHHTSTKLVLYDRIELIVPERREELIADLEARIGIKVTSIEIGHVDFLKDAAYIKVNYNLENGEVNSVDQLMKAKEFVG